MEAGLFTLRFVITGMSTKEAAEVCNTTEKTYKKWESTRIYPIDALDLIKANAGANATNNPEQLPSKDDGLDKARKVLNESFQESTTANVINFPSD
jgi:hypothetical protein